MLFLRLGQAGIEKLAVIGWGRRSGEEAGGGISTVFAKTPQYQPILREAGA